jgi:hypothetical protein
MPPTRKQHACLLGIDPHLVVAGRLEMAGGSLLLGVDCDGGGGTYFTWRSADKGKTWESDRKCDIECFKSKFGFFGGETWLWQARSGKVWALVRVDSNEFPIAGRPIKAGNDQSDHFQLYSSDDAGQTFRRVGDFGDYGEMYVSILRLADRRLLLTFTVRDLRPPLAHGRGEGAGHPPQGRGGFARPAGVDDARGPGEDSFARRPCGPAGVAAPPPGPAVIRSQPGRRVLVHRPLPPRNPGTAGKSATSTRDKGLFLLAFAPLRLCVRFFSLARPGREGMMEVQERPQIRAAWRQRR